MACGGDPPAGPYEWDAWISFRSNEFGNDEELAIQLYTALSAKSWRVFYAPVCLPPKTKFNTKEWELKYLHACANSVIAVPIISRHSFKGRDFDVTSYVWSSNADELLLEWDLMLELYDRGRLVDILPCLVGDLTDAEKQKTQTRISERLGITVLDEMHITKRVRELFRFADKDNSGFVDRDELADCFHKFGLGVSDEELDDLLEEADDGDCEVDVFEFENLIIQLLEDKAGIVLRPEKSKNKKAPKSQEETIAAMKQASPARRRTGQSPLGSTLKQSAGHSQRRRNRTAGSSASVSSRHMPSTGISGRNTATPASNEEHEDVLTDDEESVVGADEFQSGLKGRTAAQDDLDEMWTMLEEEAGDGQQSDSESAEGHQAFYTNFRSSGHVPQLTRTVVAQAQRRISAWLHLELNYGTNEVLWRAPHMRPIPTMDSQKGGRNIEDTVKCILGCPNAHLVEGFASLQLEYMVKAVEKCWEQAIRLEIAAPRDSSLRGARRPKEILCASTGRPAKYRDPLTFVPFRDMHTFHMRRQCFYFDIKKCHEDIIMENTGTRVSCTQTGGRTVLLTPPIGPMGTSYVEFEIQNEGRVPYFCFGICEGKNDVHGGWTATSDDTSVLYLAADGQKQIRGHVEPYTRTLLRRMDRVGLLVDMDRGVFEVLINDESQGVLTQQLPRPMFFVVDMGWPYQRIEILPRTHWQMMAAMLLKFFKGMNAEERLGKMQELFCIYDADGEGSIGKDEFRIALESMQVHVSDQELDELVAKVDTDGSGEIEFDEFRAMIDGMIDEYGPEAVANRKKARSPLFSPNKL